MATRWGYLARAYEIKEYAYMRHNESENTPEENDRTEEEADAFEQVKADIEDLLEMADDNYISARETPYEYRTIKQCKKWLKDFGGKNERKRI